MKLLHAVLVIASTAFAFTASTPHRHGPSKWDKTHFDYREVVPIRVNAAGDAYSERSQFLSYSNSVKDSGPLFYNLTVFGRTLRFRLLREHSFVSPGLVVEHVFSANQRLPVDGGLKHCFYRGHLEGDPVSSALLSVCAGLRGTFLTRGQEYFIEPKEQERDGSSNYPRKVHIVYRHSGRWRAEDGNVTAEDTCGLKETFQPLNQTEPSDDNDDDIRPRGRGKRYIERGYVETMITADKSMVDAFPSTAELQSFLITVMGMVARIYRDKTIGNSINIVLVKIIILERHQSELQITSNAASSLRSFCKWQTKMNKPTDKEPEHFDTAILMTRQDICRARGKCDTLGLAELGTICNPSRSCSIVEDTGLSSAFTIAHELAHVFNVPHDGDHNECTENNRNQNLMAPSLSFNTRPWLWSPCSRKAIRQFLDLGYGKCLEDPPDARQKADYETRLPGEKYDANYQCQLIFGDQSRLCPFMEPCKRLWCVKSIGKRQGCQTHHMPWADGTSCGVDKWCIRGKCVKNGTLNIIKGEWGHWGTYGSCSRSCGGGIHFAYRECNNPAPENGGEYCRGSRKRFKSCNPEACPRGSKDFRGLQCAQLNGKPVRISGLGRKRVNWLPKYHDVRKEDQCKLYCRVESHPIYFKKEDKVIDGTPCNQFSSDVCVDGKCIPAGCDRKVGSNARYDVCGVCKGNGTTCKKLSGTYNKRTKYGYNTVYKIPRGSTDITVTQYGSRDDDNFLALKRTRDSKYLINGGYVVGLGKREIRLEGARIWYSGSDKPRERITITGKTPENLLVEILAVGRLSPPNVRYTLNVPQLNVPQRFEWGFSRRWSKCSHICQGRRRRRVRCMRVDDGRFVKDRSKCKHLPRPTAPNEKCNTHCQLRWRTQPVGKCSARCGSGQQKLAVRCMQLQSNKWGIVQAQECVGMRKPPSVTSCQGLCENTRWVYTQWSQCSRTCGRGVQTRRANCEGLYGAFVPDSDCRASDRGILQQVCEAACPQWAPGAWGQCSVSCGSGVQSRSIVCRSGSTRQPDSACQQAVRPAFSKPCNQYACPRWQPGIWSPCSVTCGAGQRSRQVTCRSADNRTVLRPERCDKRTRPNSRERCAHVTCPIEAHMRPLWVWRVGQWTTCSRSCGEGSRRRRVTCSDDHGNQVDNRHCDVNARPAASEKCTLRPCTSWKHGEWGLCSLPCGKGTQSRIVKCAFDNWKIAEDNKCDPSKRPPDQQACEVEPCDELAYSLRATKNTSPGPTDPFRPLTPTRRYTWTTGHWGACSVTCGKGIRRRSVNCRRNGQRSHACNIASKPPAILVCNMGACPSWISGHWSQCSVTCGVGIRVRTVRCSGQSCDVSARPAERERCDAGVCPTWVTKPWGQCSVTCGNGFKSREVHCSTDNVNCNRATRPAHLQKCLLPRCPRWRMRAWGECSVSCGQGVQTRAIECDSSIQKCDARRKPSVSRNCNNGVCPPTWIEGPWSECSVSCGEGIQLHTVVCSSGLESQCDRRTRPAETRKCTLPDCPGWVTGQWSKCSRSCGVGTSRRSVTCSSRDTPCYALSKPAGIKGCNVQECPRWTAGMWSQCSVTCGRGQRRRTVQCVPKNSKCDRRYKPSETGTCTLVRCPEWTVGTWTECSVTCGKGVTTRSVRCRPSAGRCDTSTRPTSTRECVLETCPTWKAAPWGKCSTTCGAGVQARSVYCSASGVRQCEGNKPPSTRRCNVRLCPVWIAEQWSECSVSCGQGVQSRAVECSTDEFECNNETKPPSTQRCNRTECPVWTAGTWSECSVSCGEGHQRRPVECQSRQGHCDRRTRPVDTQRCNLGACPLWVPGSWSQCSVSCGEGVRRRTVECNSDDRECDGRSRPVEMQRCNLGGCPTWESGRWSICSVTCGDGTQSRDVECSTRDNRCSKKPRPLLTRKCNLGACPVWRAGSWDQCSVTCGEGVTRRSVVCSSGDNRCHNNTKPASTKPCQLAGCPTWASGEWSECSASCGGGVRRRTVTCSPDPKGCDVRTRPAQAQQCNNHSCPVWTPGPWNECSVTCGKGIQTRMVGCDMTNGPCDPDSRPTTTRQCVRPDCPAWTTGPWEQCSVTCGVGTKRRTVACIPSNGKCNQNLKPVSTQRCALPECPRWTAGPWSRCSATCSNGVQTRKIFCSSRRGDCDPETQPLGSRECNMGECPTWTAGNWSECSLSCGVGRRVRSVRCTVQDKCDKPKPATLALCNMGPCAFWETGAWSQCSVSCGKGVKTRTVLCSGSKTSACDVRTKPQTTSACGSDRECPTWRIGQWSPCSRTCGIGITSLQVQCVQGNKTLPFPSCDSNTRPVIRRVCQLLECVEGAEWQTEDWGECSSRCSAGTQTREIWCATRNGTKIHDKYCSRPRRPGIQRSCNRRRRCGEWEAGAWGECSRSCGDGTKTRALRCLYNIEYADEVNCDRATQPIDQLPCHKRACPLLTGMYRWITTPWTKCSRTCGYGRKSRYVTCVDRQGTQVTRSHCSGQPMPAEYLPCFEVRCPPKWKVGDWSECSRSCGDGGYQVRPVTCQGVPGVDECNKRNKPPIWRPCHFGPCNGEFQWRVGPWSECSVTCGTGQMKRAVRCFNHRTELMPDVYCRQPALKPDEARPCHMPPCTPRTCREIQLTSGLQADGEHVLQVQARLLKIYCHGMTTDDPLEYVTLKSGYKDNFAEVYTKRLLNPRECPANGKHIDSCQCHTQDYIDSGASYFTKLRIDLAKMKFIPEDLRFAETRGLKPPPYATAGDCYSSKRCPQGRFSINLEGTGLELSPDVRWRSTGKSVTQLIYRYPEGKHVIGKCGGRCGTCSPASGVGLKVIVSKGHGIR